MFANREHMWDLMDIPGRSNDARDLARFYLDRSIWNFENVGAGMWGMYIRLNNMLVFIGYTGVVNDAGSMIDLGSKAEIGWAIGPDYGGKGFATEGTRRIVTHLIERFGTRRIVAITSPDNHASRRLMTRLGLVHEGNITAYQGDQVVYSVDRDDWLNHENS